MGFFLFLSFSFSLFFFVLLHFILFFSDRDIAGKNPAPVQWRLPLFHAPLQASSRGEYMWEAVGLARGRGRAENIPRHPITTSASCHPHSVLAPTLQENQCSGSASKINTGEEIPSAVTGTVVSAAPFFPETVLLWDGVLRICQHFYYKPQSLEVYKRSHLK